MLVRVVTLPFKSAAGGFDDSELRDFIKDKEVISIRDHLFICNEIPYLALLVKYLGLRVEAAASLVASKPNTEKQNKREGAEEWRKILTEADMGLFQMLREWRSKQCKKEGVPPYVIFTNNEFAQIIKLRPQSLMDLGKLSGIGKAKIEKYGTAILEFFQGQLELPANDKKPEQS